MMYKRQCQMFKHLVKEKEEAEAMKASKDVPEQDKVEVKKEVKK